MVIAYTYAEFPLLRDCLFMQMRRDKNNLRIIARRDTYRFFAVTIYLNVLNRFSTNLAEKAERDRDRNFMRNHPGINQPCPLSLRVSPFPSPPPHFLTPEKPAETRATIIDETSSPDATFPCTDSAPNFQRQILSTLSHHPTRIPSGRMEIPKSVPPYFSPFSWPMGGD